MNPSNFHLASKYIGETHATRARERMSRIEKRLGFLLEKGCLPEKGFAETEIKILLNQFCALDVNNWNNISGVGEREGRVLLDMIKSRHYGFSHGIGRSGDITAVQPKAAGSSLLNQLTNRLLLDWLQRSGSSFNVFT